MALVHKLQSSKYPFLLYKKLNLFNSLEHIQAKPKICTKYIMEVA